MSTYTSNYNIPQYESEDKPNLRDQYNAAMDVIDTQLKKESDDVVVAIATANNAKETADKAQEGIDELTPKVEQNTTNIATNTADIATNKENIATNTADIATNKENIATNKENIATNTADIATLQSITEQHTEEINDVMGDISSAEADIATINNKLATYGTAATKNFETTLTPTGANLPTSKAVADYVSGLTPDVGEWELVAEGTSNFYTMQIPMKLFVNKAIKLAMLKSYQPTSLYNATGASDNYASSAFTIPTQYRFSQLDLASGLSNSNRTLLALGYSCGIFIDGTEYQVKAQISNNKAITAAGYLEGTIFWQYDI